jgi:hypothetical protein
MSEESAAINELTLTIGDNPGFPLNKRETFAAFIMMGLASRLQPLHITNNKESQQHQANLVSLGFKLADMAVAESDKEE